MRIIPIAKIALLAAVISSCSGAGSTASSDTHNTDVNRALVVAASFYPIEEITNRVGGDFVITIEMTPPGQSAHDVQLTIKDREELASASLVFYMGNGFQPDIEKAVTTLPAKITAVDLLQSVPLLPIDAQLEGTVGIPDGEVLSTGQDPHVWLDPANMIAMTHEITDAMVKARPDLSAEFEANAIAYIKELETLGTFIDTSFAQCESDVLVTSHRAFAYFAKRAHLTQVAIAGVNPEEEPSVKNLETIAAFAKANKVSTIFFETLLPADLAQTLATKVGATTDVLDPVEGIDSDARASGATYISIQQDNVARVVKGLRCS